MIFNLFSIEPVQASKIWNKSGCFLDRIIKQNFQEFFSKRFF